MVSKGTIVRGLKLALSVFIGVLAMELLGGEVSKYLSNVNLPYTNTLSGLVIGVVIAFVGKYAKAGEYGVIAGASAFAYGLFKDFGGMITGLVPVAQS